MRSCRLRSESIFLVMLLHLEKELQEVKTRLGVEAGVKNKLRPGEDARPR